MLTEPIIDIIVYGYPSYLPISLSDYVYTTTDYNGHIHLYVKNEYIHVFPILQNKSVIALPMRQQIYVVNKNELTSNTFLSGYCESNISLLDTRDYFDWTLNADEIWSDEPNISNGEYIRGAGSVFNSYLHFRNETSIKTVSSLNCRVGILFDWQKDDDETWADNPDITNQDYLQITIN